MSKNMRDELAIFFSSLKSGSFFCRVDEPIDRENGRWFIDFKLYDELFTVEYKDGLGFGFYHLNDGCYGETPNFYLNSSYSLFKLRCLGFFSANRDAKPLEYALSA